MSAKRSSGAQHPVCGSLIQKTSLDAAAAAALLPTPVPETLAADGAARWRTSAPAAAAA